MEVFELKNNNQNEIILMEKQSNGDILVKKEKDNIREKDKIVEKKNSNSLKSRSQSFSTYCEDKEKNINNDDIKTFISLKSLVNNNNPNQIFSSKAEKLLKLYEEGKNNANNNFEFRKYKDINKLVFNNNLIKSNCNILSKSFITYKNAFIINFNKLFISKRNKFYYNYVTRSFSIKKNNLKKNEQNPNKKDILYKKIEKELKPNPPIAPELFNIMNKLNENSNYYNKNIYKNNIPNVFYNHLMIKNNKCNNNTITCSIIKRTKGKKLNIIYYRPKLL